MAERLRSAARVMARLHQLDPASVGLGGEPVARPPTKSSGGVACWRPSTPRWCPAGATSARSCADRSPPRSRPPSCTATFASATCSPRESRSPPSSTGRSGRSGTRGSTSAGSWSTPIPRPTGARRRIRAHATARRARRTSTPPRWGATCPGLDWFMGLACFKSAATWSLIVKLNRRRPAPDPTAGGAGRGVAVAAGAGRALLERAGVDERRALMAEWFLYMSQYRMPIDDFVVRSTAAEDTGFDGVAFFDHLETPGMPSAPVWEAMGIATWVPPRPAGSWSATWCCATRSGTPPCWPSRPSRSPRRRADGSSSASVRGRCPRNWRSSACARAMPPIASTGSTKT